MKEKTLYTIYSKDIKKYPTIRKEMERELSERIQRHGDMEAMKELITANLKLVVYIAYDLYDTRYGLDFLDMVQEGNLALMDAASVWNYENDINGSGFGNFAATVIRRSLKRHIYTDSRIVSYPLRNLAYKGRVRQIQEIFMQKHNRKPTEEELSLLTGLTQQSIRLIFECDLPTVSLDVTGGSNDDGDDINAERMDALQFDVEHCELGGITVTCSEESSKEIKETIQAMIKILPPLQKKIILYYYGLEGHPHLSVAEIAVVLGKSVRRINQLKKEALQRLKLYNYTEPFDMV